ncbi:hypothetical protein ATANTOWER_007927 [Ataeniobius toweri]|uniref:Uncharacterized protein n=1 Tax=Ataeniobius toweri TaxID=208326 RepID=A0ABU7AQ26_9TELE|nr:hypothetical protein [Ataeniobius toweri]
MVLLYVINPMYDGNMTGAALKLSRVDLLSQCPALLLLPPGLDRCWRRTKWQTQNTVKSFLKRSEAGQYLMN